MARTAVQAEKLEDDGALDEAAERLLDPHVGALTQIVDQYKPEGTPIIVGEVVRDVDTIVKQVRYTGWNDTQSGDRTVRRELRQVLKKYALPRERRQDSRTSRAKSVHLASCPAAHFCFLMFWGTPTALKCAETLADPWERSVGV